MIEYHKVDIQNNIVILKRCMLDVMQFVKTHPPEIDTEHVLGLVAEIEILSNIVRIGNLPKVIDQAHHILSKFGLVDFHNLLGTRLFSLREQLTSRLDYLAQKTTAFSLFVHAAKKIAHFKKLKILFCPVDKQNQNTESHIKAWSLEQTFQKLDLPLDEIHVRAAMGDSWTETLLRSSFKEVQGLGMKSHAESLLVRYAAKIGLDKVSGQQYIGCSKSPCFLCYEFTRLHGGFLVRESHDKFEAGWTVDAVNTAREDNANRLHAAVVQIVHSVEKRLHSMALHAVNKATEQRTNKNIYGDPEAIDHVAPVMEYISDIQTEQKDQQNKVFTTSKGKLPTLTDAVPGPERVPNKATYDVSQLEARHSWGSVLHQNSKPGKDGP